MAKGHMTHEARHDKIIKHLDQADHLTKKGGGKATHGANFKVAEEGEIGKSSTKTIGPTGNDAQGIIDKSNYGTKGGPKPPTGSGDVEP